ncbi:MAG TPA: carbohydrate ABC transporter permease [Microbacterium sp.]|nr:carbohydrate ABC transporter permease [Microbacterium sp.]
MKTSSAAKIAGHSTAYLATLIFLFPVYVLINLSIRPPGDLTTALIPSARPTLDNFVNAWTESSLPGAIVTSIVVTAISSVVVIVIATMASYPLARSTTRWSNVAFYAFLVGLLLPFQLAFLPLYAIMRDLQLIGTIWSLIIVYAGTTLPFSIFLITTFLRTSVPTEYEEAAQIDGCSPVGVFRHVVMPLLRPVIGTCVILNGVSIWNDFFTPLVYLTGGRQVTIPMAIYQFVGQYASNWPLIFASLIISMIPVLAVYLVFQRYVIQGFAGGLKG